MTVPSIDRATHIDCDCPEIRFVQLFIDTHRRNTLHFIVHTNELEAIEAAKFHAQLAKLHFLSSRRSLKATEEQYRKSQGLASTNNQHLQVHWRMAQYYLFAVVGLRAVGRFAGEPWRKDVAPFAQKGRQAFEQASKCIPNSPGLWHSYSLLELESGHPWRAARYNKKSIRLRPSRRAIEIRERLLKRIWFLYYLAY
jgi:hypothetical protein